MRASPHADPGYGDPNAPIGSAEWAKRWRLCFQTAVKELPRAPRSSLEYFKIGSEHRAWTLVTDEGGRHYPDFDSFCRDRQPYGLEVDPAKFRAYLKAEVGERDADLITVSPGDDKGGAPEGNRNAAKGRGEESTGTIVVPVDSGGMSPMKAKNLRAVLRSPEVVQQLYREGKVSQTTAAKLGPKSPSPEQASKIAEARKGLEQLDPGLKPREFRKAADAVVKAALNVPDKTPLDHLRAWWAKASPEERAAFLKEVA